MDPLEALRARIQGIAESLHGDAIAPTSETEDVEDVPTAVANKWKVAALVLAIRDYQGSFFCFLIVCA